MGDTTIQWTDKTWSPIRALVKQDAAAIAESKGYTSLIGISARMAGHVGPHCEHVSHGCDNCYADVNNARCLPYNGTGLPFDRRSRDLVDTFVDEKILMQPLKWRKGKRVFVENQADLFGEWVTDGQIMRVFDVMGRASHHTFQLLTKRPERMLAWIKKWGDIGEPQMPVLARGPEETRAAHKSGRADLFASMLESMGKPPAGCAYPTYDWMQGHVYWPAVLTNVHLGVSVEDQSTADARIPLLLQTSAAKRFVSYEPALGPISFRWALWDKGEPHSRRVTQLPDVKRDGRVLAGCTDHLDGLRMLDQVIVGGESGPGARPFDIEWARNTILECREARVAVFVKQIGAKPFSKYSDGAIWSLKDRKGGTPDEWPSDLRVREFVQ
jgi:protein gp37